MNFSNGRMQNSPSTVQTDFVKPKKTQTRISILGNFVKETNVSKNLIVLPNENDVKENLTNEIECVSTYIPASVIRPTPSVKKHRPPVVPNNHPENQAISSRHPVRRG